MRCNIFKPLIEGGAFLMFSQYTDDITKEQSMKSTYRVVPSKFVALDLNIDELFNKNSNKHLSTHINVGETYSINIGDKTVTGPNNILPQIFQSYFENSVAFIHNELGDNWDIEERNYPFELLWRTLEDWGMINQKTYTDPNDSFKYYDEIKYIGDINIHSNHKVGSYSYDEVFCHIPTREDEYYYRLDNPKHIEHFDVQSEGSSFNVPLVGWTDEVYPINNPLVNRATTYHGPNDSISYDYRTGGYFPIMDISDKYNTPIARNTGKENVEYKFNAIILFYDVLYSEPGKEPRYLYRYRPMGIYLSGPVEGEGEDINLANRFTKYVTNNDAYNQGASFGLRIMMRYVPTPNMTTQVIEVESVGDDYETITAAMGSIADSISDINRLCKDQHAMYQTYKDHLAMFRNRRANVPYPREVDGRMYWFVNGRNTGQPCSVEVPRKPKHHLLIPVACKGNGKIEVARVMTILQLIQNIK